jgi:signal transduction histidine kinase
MLDFSRRSESHICQCNLHSIIDKAIALASSDYDLKKSYDFRRIQITRDESNGPAQLCCTETEIEQVLLNLLRNAAQAMSTAQPPVEQPQISIHTASLGDRVRIEVADNGPGMSAETRRRAFEPFYTTKAPGVGTGLGLSVSYFIITKGHGGTMTVDSKPGEGTRFIIELPARSDLDVSPGGRA